LPLRREHIARRHRILISIDTNREMPSLARCLEDAETRRAWRVINDVGALTILAEGELLSLAWIAKCFWRHAGVTDEDGAVGTNFSHAGPVADLELLNERRVHAADEAHFLRLAFECR